MPLGTAMRAEYVTMYGIPAVTGLILLTLYFVFRLSTERLTLLAALLTLKPIIAAPILSATVNPPPGYDGPLSAETPIPIMQLVLGILLEAGLTVLIVLVFRSLFSCPGITAPRLLLALDCIRWLNLLLSPAALFAVSLADSMALFILAWPVFVSTMLFGALMPSVFAIAAAAVVIASAGGRGKGELLRPQGD